MRIILTHEQADFDALASLLGAYLLDETAIPVLPRRMNRNVRAFVTLYGADLPFMDPRDLPSEDIESITLVDTQSMITLRGTGSKTRVHVVDHHPARGKFPNNWTLRTDDIGATTTIFVEAIQGHNGVLTVLQATLLLLGIYEDTGSLTYSRTTSRDLQSAAFLLEHGGDLRIATNFLNHPLSLQQQELYDRLRASIETHTIHGHIVLIACGDAQDMDEELSTIAHKLRDLLDPDALFLLVTTRGGVQLIARSTSDQIDVADIAAHFGGGGHERAAAGLIRRDDLQDIHSRLLHLLPDLIRPAVTVSQIMSRDPQVLTPETPVQEAATRMQRFGYEGYPVVRSGKVVGLLTRRAVDRAITHKLNIFTASLMEAGEVTVKPDDSIDHLQRLMTDTGWGQIPVVQPDTGVIIGIVTRTDLLKILTSQSKSDNHLNLTERLENALSPVHIALLKAVAQMAHEKHMAIYIVGGFVRDLLLDRPSQDFDLVVEGDAIDLARSLSKKYGGRITSHSRFGTAKWYLSDNINNILAKGGSQTGQLADTSNLPRFLDLISARTEFYTYPTALPTVERGSIKLDLHRRDFTINTLALRLDGPHYGELQDYWGGLNDLRQGLVRVLHSLSFVDDPTRMLRAVRFEQRFGFKIEERTLQLLQEALNLLDRVSGDRIRHELDHILDETLAPNMLARLDELNLLIAIHSDLKWDAWLQTRFESIPVNDPDPDWGIPGGTGWLHNKITLAYTLWCIRLPPERAASVLYRLKIARALSIDILATCHVWLDLLSLVNVPPSVVANRLDEVSPLTIFALCLGASDPKICNILRAYVTTWRKVTPRITGDDLRARGLPPGPIYKTILSTLRNAWLDGEISTIEQETVLMETIISEYTTGDDD